MRFRRRALHWVLSISSNAEDSDGTESSSKSLSNCLVGRFIFNRPRMAALRFRRIRNRLRLVRPFQSFCRSSARLQRSFSARYISLQSAPARLQANRRFLFPKTSKAARSLPRLSNPFPPCAGEKNAPTGSAAGSAFTRFVRRAIASRLPASSRRRVRSRTSARDRQCARKQVATLHVRFLPPDARHHQQIAQQSVQIEVVKFMLGCLIARDIRAVSFRTSDGGPGSATIFARVSISADSKTPGKLFRRNGC